MVHLWEGTDCIRFGELWPANTGLHPPRQEGVQFVDHPLKAGASVALRDLPNPRLDPLQAGIDERGITQSQRQAHKRASERERFLAPVSRIKGLCHLGLHKMDWTYCQSPQAITLNHPVSPPQLRDLLSRVCRQDGVCRRCGAKGNGTHHDYEKHLKAHFWGLENEYWECTRCGEWKWPAQDG